jgi:hypothetical protein
MPARKPKKQRGGKPSELTLLIRRAAAMLAAEQLPPYEEARATAAALLLATRGRKHTLATRRAIRYSFALMGRRLPTWPPRNP